MDRRGRLRLSGAEGADAIGPNKSCDPILDLVRKRRMDYARKPSNGRAVLGLTQAQVDQIVRKAEHGMGSPPVLQQGLNGREAKITAGVERLLAIGLLERDRATRRYRLADPPEAEAAPAPPTG